MKKFSLFVVTLAVIGMFGAFAPVSVQASTLPASQVLGADTASLLKQTLNAMQSLLNLMSSRLADTVNPLSDNQKIALSGVLGGIKVSLAGINTTVASLEQKTIAYSNIPSGVSANTQAVTVPVTEGSEIAQGATEGTEPTIDVRDISNNNEVAAVGVSSRMKGVLWGLLALLIVIVAGFLFFRSRDEQEQGEVPESPMNTQGAVYEMGKIDAVNEVLAQSPVEDVPAPADTTAPLPMA